MSDNHGTDPRSATPRVVTVRVRELGGLVPTGTALRVSVLVDGPADAASTVAGRTVIADWDGAMLDVPVTCSADAENLVAFAHFGGADDIAEGDWLTTVSYPVHADRVEITLDQLT